MSHPLLPSTMDAPNKYRKTALLLEKKRIIWSSLDSFYICAVVRKKRGITTRAINTKLRSSSTALITRRT